MSDLQIAQRITEEDLLRLGAEDKRYEVVEGELVEMPVIGIRHQEIAGNIHLLLRSFVKQNRRGYVHVSGLLYVIWEDISGLKEAYVPDISFIRAGRLTNNFDRKRPFPGAPDLAVEVISPGEGADILLDKINSYLTYGTQQIWVVYPEQQHVHVYDREQPDHITVYHHDDVMEPAALFPGLQIKIADFFVEEDFEVE